MSGMFSPPPRVSDPGMHHGTCVTHVPWCMPGSLINGFLCSRWRGKRSRHSQRMRNSQFYVPGNRPIGYMVCLWYVWLFQYIKQTFHFELLLFLRDICVWIRHNSNMQRVCYLNNHCGGIGHRVCLISFKAFVVCGSRSAHTTAINQLRSPRNEIGCRLRNCSSGIALHLKYICFSFPVES